MLFSTLGHVLWLHVYDLYGLAVYRYFLLLADNWDVFIRHG